MRAKPGHIPAQVSEAQPSLQPLGLRGEQFLRQAESDGHQAGMAPTANVLVFTWQA